MKTRTMRIQGAPEGGGGGGGEELGKKGDGGMD